MPSKTSEPPFHVLYRQRPVITGNEAEAHEAYRLLTSHEMVTGTPAALELVERIRRERNVEIKGGEIALFDVNAGRVIERQGIALRGDLSDFDERR